VDPNDDTKGYMWTIYDVYFERLGDYLSRTRIPINAQGKPYFEEYPCNKDGSYSEWSDDLIPVSPDGVPLWSSNPFWLTLEELEGLY